jgi:predicted amidohydrolase YtcJ
MLREPVERLERRLAEGYRVHRYADARLTVGGVKRSIDGALGPHGAWLLEPYADMPESAGLNTTPVEDVEACADLCARHDLQLCVHAIGDRANREVLDVYQAAFEEHGRGPERRWRIEHAQHLHPDDIPRFAKLGVVAAMQGVHCTSDAPWVMARLGPERAEEGAYVWRALLDSGAVIANGTDAPVEDVDPLASFYASVSRRLADGTPWYPEQCMTRLEALRSYTLDAAWAAFEEDIKGSLVPGKLGDVTVLSKDILTCPVEEIREARVLYTIVGGEVAYAAESTR